MDNLKNAADEEQVKKMGEREKNKTQRENDDLRFLLNHPQFKRFANDILGFCDCFSSPCETNTMVQSYRAGMKNVGLYLIGKLESADLQALYKLKEEARNV